MVNLPVKVFRDFFMALELHIQLFKLGEIMLGMRKVHEICVFGQEIFKCNGYL